MGGKSATGSATIIGAVVIVIVQIAQLFGYFVSETDAAVLRTIIESGVLVVTSLVTIVGSVVAIWGRWRATQQITSILPHTPTTADLNRSELDRLRGG